MKRKILAVAGAAALTMAMWTTPMAEVQAADRNLVTADGSVLLEQETESVGEITQQTRGAYLQSGSSSIGKIGTGKIRVSGTTIAQRVVSTIKLSVEVQRLIGDHWATYTTWSVSDSNTYALTSAKTLTVPRGYYYRVCCIHSANSDISDSNTSGILVD